MSKYQIPGVRTHEFTKLIGVENMHFGKNVIIDDFVLIYAKARMDIGNYVHIASFVSISGGAEFVMDDFSGISQGCRIILGTDDFKNWGFGGPPINKKYRNLTIAPIHIGKFCIIGANSVILPGVFIGEGAMVGACSVVTKDLEPWGIFIGNKKVGERNKKGVLKNYKKFLIEEKNI